MDMGEFSLVGVDHMVIETNHVDEVTRMFLNQLKFRSACSTGDAELVRGDCRVRVTPPRNNNDSLIKTHVGSVTDIAYVVTGLEAFLTRVRSLDARIILEDITSILCHPRLGRHRRALVKVRRSCVGAEWRGNAKKDF